MNLMRGIDLQKIAAALNGASGAEVKAACTEAGMFALRERRVHVSQEDFEMAVSKVVLRSIKSPDCLLHQCSFSGHEKRFRSRHQFEETV